MNASPQRLAWTVLFTALFICVALTVGVPAAIYGYLNNATDTAALQLSLQSGILATHSPVESAKEARVVDLAGREFKEEHTFIAGDRSFGLLTFARSADETPYMAVQLYSNAQGTVTRARIPRFAASTASDEFDLTLNAGRIDVLAEPPTGRRFQMRITHAAGVVRIDEAGQYSIEIVDGQLHVTAHAGKLRLTTTAADETLAAPDAAVADAEGNTRREEPMQELLRNGFFRRPLQESWGFTTDVDALGEVRGTASRIARPNEPGTLLLERVGENIGWGRTSLSQRIDASVSDAAELRLRVVFTILEQQLAVCGSEGTECPLMVRIDYTTKDGRSDFWLQGFYAKGDPSVVKLPDYVRSNFRGNHIAKPMGAKQVFESENLLQQLGRPQRVNAITVYAEGHALRTSVDSVELAKR